MSKNKSWLYVNCLPTSTICFCPIFKTHIQNDRTERTTPEKATSAISTAVCYVQLDKKDWHLALFNALEPGNCCIARILCKIQSWPSARLSLKISQKRNNVFGSIVTALECTPVLQNSRLFNFPNSNGVGPISPPILHSKLCGSAEKPFLPRKLLVSCSE